MVQTGKRSQRRDRERDGERDDDNDRRNQKRRTVEKHSSSRAEGLVLYRILCPSSVIGSVIGKSGKVIKSIRQDTNAKVEVVDPYPGCDNRVILVYCYIKNREQVDIEGDFKALQSLSPAQDALIKVHEAIVNALANTEKHDGGNKEEAELLVPSSQSSALIGKSGSIIKRLRLQSGANIKVIPKEADDENHSCAMKFDNFVQIIGDAEAVKKALYYISAVMYNYPPKEEISLDTSVPQPQGLQPHIIIPSDPPIYPASSLYPGPETLLPPVIGVAPHQSDVRNYNGTYGGLPVYVSDYGIPRHSGELTVRVLCPSDKIGRVIGKGGSVIKGLRQDSGADIDVDDMKKKYDECVIKVTSTESTSDEKSACVEAILLLQQKINEESDESAKLQLLVPSKVIGCLIGKNGTIINSLRKMTKATIYVSKGEKPKYAASDDELVEVSGDVRSVRDALVQITLRLREDVLRDRDENGKIIDTRGDNGYSGGISGLPVLPYIPPPSAPALAHAPSLTPLDYDLRADRNRGLGSLPSRDMYGYGSLQSGDREYEPLPLYGAKSYGGSLVKTLGTENDCTTFRVPSFSELAIPSHALSKVLGKSGSNLTTISNLSGADIEIVDSPSSRYERIAKISGTSEQRRAAENMIQAFILST